MWMRLSARARRSMSWEISIIFVMYLWFASWARAVRPSKLFAWDIAYAKLICNGGKFDIRETRPTSVVENIFKMWQLEYWINYDAVCQTTKLELRDIPAEPSLNQIILVLKSSILMRRNIFTEHALQGKMKYSFWLCDHYSCMLAVVTCTVARAGEREVLGPGRIK